MGQKATARRRAAVLIEKYRNLPCYALFSLDLPWSQFVFANFLFEKSLQNPKRTCAEARICPDCTMISW
jgi:hypothetical protein